MVATLDGLCTSEAARELGVSRSYVDKLVKQGKLPYVNTTLGRLIEPNAVAALKAEREAAKEAQLRELSKK